MSFDEDAYAAKEIDKHMDSGPGRVDATRVWWVEVWFPAMLGLPAEVYDRVLGPMTRAEAEQSMMTLPPPGEYDAMRYSGLDVHWKLVEDVRAAVEAQEAEESERVVESALEAFEASN